MDLTKAQAFWSRKADLRKQPGHCGRCGKPNANGLRTCDKCRSWMAQYRAGKRDAAAPTANAAAHFALCRRVANLEHYFARLSEVQRVAYNRGFCAGRRLHRKAQERATYFEALPTPTAQDLRELHA